MERKLEVPATFVSFIEKTSLPRIPQLTANYISFTRTASFDPHLFQDRLRIYYGQLFSLNSADYKGKEVGNDFAEAATIFSIPLKKNLCYNGLVSWERVVEFTKCFLSSGTFAVFLSLSCSWGPSTQRPTYCKTGREHLAMGPAGSSHSLGDLARLKAVQTKIQGFQGPQIQLLNSAIFHPAIAIVASSVPMKGARCDQVARPSPWQQGLLYSFPLGLLICFPSSELL